VTEILPLTQIAAADVEALLDAAFGKDRHERTAYKLRAGTSAIPALSFAAVQGGRLVGTLQSWPVRIESRTGEFSPLTLVGPVAVSPSLQRSGIGRTLMAHMLDVADAGAADALMMIGDPEYYGRGGLAPPRPGRTSPPLGADQAQRRRGERGRDRAVRS
jgi:predicted N-acetyltransferase YhbS